MININKIISGILLLVTTTVGFSDYIIVGNSSLAISFTNTAAGVQLVGVANNGTNLLKGTSDIFSLNITKISSGASVDIASGNNWGNTYVTNDGTHCEIVFSNAVGVALSSTLNVTFSLDVSGDKSQWDLSVDGLGNDYTLNEITIPDLKIKADGNDYFLVPKYSGKAVPDPLSTNISYNLFYPRGWAATMQMCSYYNFEYGIYLGSHDPLASYKTFSVNAENGYLRFMVKLPAPDKTIGNNNWELPGKFELDLYDGNWYDAAMIYRNWVYANANYKPGLSISEHQKEMGSIGVWGYFSSSTNYPMSSIEREMTDFTDFFPGVNVGIHWYQWNYKVMDDDYPDYFPERDGMINLVSNMQQSGKTYIMPYINGRLYDTDLPDYSTNGYPHATKHSDGSIYYQNFNGNHFAVMCPTEDKWQNIILDTATQLTARIGCSGVYIDQVCAASPVECMDINHNHTIGGGYYWRDGYAQMFSGIHAALFSNRFVTVEGGDDFLVDEVDGFLTEGWTSDNLVPVFQAVYGDKVQLFGTKTGTSTYNDPSFYCKLAQAFASGIEPGRFSLWIVHDTNAGSARPFVRNIATIRYKLREFMSFGRLMRPLTLNGNIPDITSTWSDRGVNIPVTISAIQSGVYKKGDAVAVVFVNASMTNSISFSFDFSGEDYGLGGSLTIRKITETSDGTLLFRNNNFTENLQIEPMRAVAYIVKKKPPLLFIISQKNKILYK